MSRRLAVTLALVFSLVAVTVGSAAADVLGVGGTADPDDVLPLPALPIGPGPLYPLDAYGPRLDDNVVLRWDEQTLAAIRAVKQGPTINARALGIVHTAMYDAWAAYDPVAVGTRLGGSLRQPPAKRTLARKSKAISFAAYRALLNLYPSRAAAFTAFMSALGYDPSNTSTDPSTAAGVGNLAAAAVLGFRANDGANQADGYADTSGYVPVNTPDQVNDVYRWQPLR
ncbi:MAG TPA: phosphoesterase, partial [Actinomycetes bacterium]